MKGRPAKPTAQLKLTGGYRKDRYGKRLEPKAEIPGCPDFLGRVGKAKFRDLCKVLGDVKVLTRMDRDALSLAAGVFEEWRECDNAIRSAGNRMTFGEETGRPCINPLVKLRTDAWNRYMKALIEFGMTPVARCRLQVKDQPKKHDSKAEKFFG